MSGADPYSLVTTSKVTGSAPDVIKRTFEGDKIYTFLSDETSDLTEYTINIPQGLTAEVLVVGGGGAGGTSQGGGGGGGGVLHATGLTSLEGVFTVKVGKGGAAAAHTGVASGYSGAQSQSGFASIISKEGDELEVPGGGFGGSPGPSYHNGGSGGSGGGSTYDPDDGDAAGNAGDTGGATYSTFITASQSMYYVSGGGKGDATPSGGGGGAGGTAPTNADGADGKEIDITGESLYWGGGGGGTNWQGRGGHGGLGGGGGAGGCTAQSGNGGSLGMTDGGAGTVSGTCSDNDAGAGGDGGAGTGGGGGGSSYATPSTATQKGDGGSGIVIIRLKSGGAVVSGGADSYITDIESKAEKFTGVSGWELVKYKPNSTVWFSGDHNLQGTYQLNHDTKAQNEEWSDTWDDSTQDEVLLVKGNFVSWLRCSASSLDATAWTTPTAIDGNRLTPGKTFKMYRGAGNFATSPYIFDHEVDYIDAYGDMIYQEHQDVGYQNTVGASWPNSVDNDYYGPGHYPYYVLVRNSGT